MAIRIFTDHGTRINILALLAVIAVLVCRFSNRDSMGLFITDDANSTAADNWMAARDYIGLQVIGTN